MSTLRAATALGLVASMGLAGYFHFAEERIGRSAAKTPIDVFVLDDFSHRSSHGASVLETAESSCFSRCRFTAVNVAEARGISVAKGVDQILAFRRQNPAAHLVINVSFGGSGQTSDDARLAALSNARTIIVAAAGNDASSQPTFPAAAEGVFAVAAVDETGRGKSYSNHGPHVDFAAVPDEKLAGGRYVGMTRTAEGITYTYAQRIEGGTSLSAPRVATAAASVWALHPHLTAHQVIDVLRKTAKATDPGFGTGMLAVAPLVAAVLPAKAEYRDYRGFSFFAAACFAIAFLFAALWPNEPWDRSCTVYSVEVEQVPWSEFDGR